MVTGTLLGPMPAVPNGALGAMPNPPKAPMGLAPL